MFEKDQIVKFKDAGGTAKVSRIDGDTIYVIDDFGFENAHQAHELLPMVQWQVGAVEHKDKRREKSAPAAQQIDRLSVDLHSHELLGSTNGMTRYEILNYQLDKASATVHEARRRGIAKVLIMAKVLDVYKERFTNYSERWEVASFILLISVKVDMVRLKFVL